MKNTLSNFQNSQQAGFSMLEVLITIFILGVGLLGVAGMQATSIKLSHESHLRSQASLLAYDIADRMRANPASSQTGGYDGTFTGSSAFNTDCRDSVNNPCNTGQIAITDRNNWDFKLGQTFPGVQARIATQNIVTGQTIATITLSWVDTDNNDTADINDNSTRRFRLRTII